MKFIYLTLFIVPFTLVVSAQKKGDCTSYADCVDKGVTTNFNSEKLAYFDLAVEFAKKEGVNPSDIYLKIAIANYNNYDQKKTIEKNLKSAIKADEKNFWAHAWMAAFYRDKEEDGKKSTEYLNSLFKIFPDDARIYHERGQNNKYSNPSLALTDFEMGYNLMLDEPAKVDDYTKASLARNYAMSYMRSKNITIADAKVLEILEKGFSVVKSSEKLCGDLALAYFDNEQFDKGKEIARIAVSLGSENVGRFVLGLDVYLEDEKEYNRDRAANQIKSTKYFWDSAVALSDANRNNEWDHPLINFYYALCQWYYNSVDNPDGWPNYVNTIKREFTTCVSSCYNTKYAYYGSQASNYLNELSKY